MDDTPERRSALVGSKMDKLRSWILRTRGTGERRDPAQEILRERFARGEVSAEEYKHALGILRGGGKSRATKARLLAAGLAAAVLLTAVAGVAFARSQANPPEDGTGDGMGSMMSMMTGGGQMSSMMDGQTMGSFDEDKPFDLQFIDQMTMHHEGAIMSSEHMIGDSERPELRELAQKIEESQSEQIKQMQDFRDKWYPDAEQTSGMPAGEMEEMMGGDAMEQMMGGDTTDEMFLEMMIPHHQMAVDMSEQALNQADHPELKELARKIIDEQSAEIELMKGYLQDIESTTDG
jgi:uncharacterized protein (DUF305 family)